MKKLTRPIVYRSTGGLVWNGRWGIPITASLFMAELLFNDESILIRLMNFDKFFFSKEEIQVKEVFGFSSGFGLKILHQNEKYPDYIVFGFGLFENRQVGCRQKLESIGVKFID